MLVSALLSSFSFVKNQKALPHIGGTALLPNGGWAYFFFDRKVTFPWGTVSEVVATMKVAWARSCL